MVFVVSIIEFTELMVLMGISSNITIALLRYLLFVSMSAACSRALQLMVRGKSTTCEESGI